jgi:pilus assembly protein Flp/PilA
MRASASTPANDNRHLAIAGCPKRRAPTLHEEGTTAQPAALKGGTQVEMIRSLPMRAYLAVAALRDREDGQALVEYALLLSLIAVASIGILKALGTNISGIFNEVNNEV